MSPKLIEQVKHIQLKASQMVTYQLVGHYQSAFKGSGMEFDKVRQYDPGDDARLLDWNVTARMQQPYSRVYCEERERTLMVMVDVSASQAWASTHVSKNEMCAEFAAVVALLATQHNDRVGLIVFSDKIEHYIPPKRGKSHVWQMIRDILSYENPQGKTDIKAALQWLLKVQKKPSLCFLISDFCDEKYEKELQHIASRHDLIAVQVLDQFEREIPPIGEVSIADLETQKSSFWNFSSNFLQKKYQEGVVQQQSILKKLFGKYGIDHLVMEPQDGFFRPLMQLMKSRERRSL
ncbi:MAG: DUF58 domain-containing protein [Oligoflexales bacterium]